MNVRWQRPKDGLMGDKDCEARKEPGLAKDISEVMYGWLHLS